MALVAEDDDDDDNDNVGSVVSIVSSESVAVDRGSDDGGGVFTTGRSIHPMIPLFSRV